MGSRQPGEMAGGAARNVATRRQIQSSAIPVARELAAAICDASGDGSTRARYAEQGLRPPAEDVCI